MAKKKKAESSRKSQKIVELRPKDTPTDAGLLRPEGMQGNTQVDKVMRMLTDAKVELFCSPEGKSCASLHIGGMTDTYDLESLGACLQHLYFESERRPLPKNVLTEVLEVLHGRAVHLRATIPVYTRVGADSTGALYLDLADANRTVVQIDRDGWRVVGKPPIRFRRIPGELALPMPVNGPVKDAMAAFRGLLNVGKDDDIADLVLAWLIGSLWPTGPYPVMALYGEPDSGKSTTTQMLKSLIDPASPVFKPVPRDEYSMALTAERTWVFATDNVRVIPEWMADALCKISTGAGGAARKHYSQQEEVLISVKRPIILNGTYAPSLREDLLSRALLVELPTLPKDRHVSEESYWRQFDATHPAILGMLLTALSGSLAGTKTPAIMPRMADWATRISRAESALGWPEDWFSAILMNRVRDDQHNQTRLENPLVWAILNDAYFSGWKGTVAELGEALLKRGKPGFRQANGHWLGSPTSLGMRLRSAQELLLEGGLKVTFSTLKGFRFLRFTPTDWS